MKAKHFLLAFAALPLLLASVTLGQSQKTFNPQWKKVARYRIPAGKAGEYREILTKMKGLSLKGRYLSPEKGYSLFENRNSLVLTQGNEDTEALASSSVTSIPGLGERIKFLFPNGSVLAYYCTCKGEGGDCRIWELNCVKEGCSDCGSYWVIGSPGRPPIIIQSSGP